MCRQLGLGSGTAQYNAYSALSSSYSIVLNDVTCGGYEAQLSECPQLPWGYNTCAASQAVGVSCDPQASLRLVGGTKYYSGAFPRMELCYCLHVPLSLYCRARPGSFGCATRARQMTVCAFLLFDRCVTGAVQQFNSQTRQWSPVCAATFGNVEAVVKYHMMSCTMYASEASSQTQCLRRCAPCEHDWEELQCLILRRFPWLCWLRSAAVILLLLLADGVPIDGLREWGAVDSHRFSQSHIGCCGVAMVVQSQLVLLWIR